MKLITQTLILVLLYQSAFAQKSFPPATGGMQDFGGMEQMPLTSGPQADQMSAGGYTGEGYGSPMGQGTGYPPPGGAAMGPGGVGGNLDLDDFSMFSNRDICPQVRDTDAEEEILRLEQYMQNFISANQQEEQEQDQACSIDEDSQNLLNTYVQQIRRDAMPQSPGGGFGGQSQQSCSPEGMRAQESYARAQYELYLTEKAEIERGERFSNSPSTQMFSSRCEFNSNPRCAEILLNTMISDFTRECDLQRTGNTSAQIAVRERTDAYRQSYGRFQAEQNAIGALTSFLGNPACRGSGELTGALFNTLLMGTGVGTFAPLFGGLFNAIKGLFEGTDNTDIAESLLQSQQNHRRLETDMCLNYNLQYSAFQCGREENTQQLSHARGQIQCLQEQLSSLPLSNVDAEFQRLLSENSLTELAESRDNMELRRRGQGDDTEGGLTDQDFEGNEVSAYNRLNSYLFSEINDGSGGRVVVGDIINEMLTPFKNNLGNSLKAYVNSFLPQGERVPSEQLSGMRLEVLINRIPGSAQKDQVREDINTLQRSAQIIDLNNEVMETESYNMVEERKREIGRQILELDFDRVQSRLVNMIPRIAPIAISAGSQEGVTAANLERVNRILSASDGGLRDQYTQSLAMYSRTAQAATERLRNGDDTRGAISLFNIHSNLYLSRDRLRNAIREIHGTLRDSNGTAFGNQSAAGYQQALGILNSSTDPNAAFTALNQLEGANLSTEVNRMQHLYKLVSHCVALENISGFNVSSDDDRTAESLNVSARNERGINRTCEELKCSRGIRDIQAGVNGQTGFREVVKANACSNIDNVDSTFMNLAREMFQSGTICGKRFDDLRRD